ncbi:8-oxoguanine deaminase [soil metagenome]
MTADLVITGARCVATVDAERRELDGGWVAVTDGLISGVGEPGTEPDATEHIDAKGCLVTPGLVNTHSHFWQNLTRSYGPMTGADFLGWLAALYPLWATIDEEAAYISARVALAELAAGGCTTSSDHLYLQPPDQPSLVAAEIRAAADAGMRFHAVRGAVDRGERDGSPMPDRLVERIEDVLADTERLVAAHHDPTPASMVRMAIGPHSVFAATTELMEASAELAERLDIRLHTHLSGDSSDEGYCLDLHGVRPVEWFESTGWASSRTWVAHCFHPSPEEIGRLGAAGVGVAHCATAGLLMGVGVAPVPELRAAGCPVGIGGDGSANSDSLSMWMEARTVLLANRLRNGPAAFGARQVLEMATRDGAACLGRSGEIGELTIGANADVAVWPLTGLAWSGAVTDPIEAWLRCGPSAPRHVLVGGSALVRDGALTATDLPDVLARHDAAARRMQQVGP